MGNMNKTAVSETFKSVHLPLRFGAEEISAFTRILIVLIFKISNLISQSKK